VGLIYFHRFLIFCAILFGAYFGWRLWRDYQRTEDWPLLAAAIGAAIVTVGLCLYLPTVRARRSPASKT
jgi:hypothetical protein